MSTGTHASKCTHTLQTYINRKYRRKTLEKHTNITEILLQHASNFDNLDCGFVWDSRYYKAIKFGSIWRATATVHTVTGNRPPRCTHMNEGLCFVTRFMRIGCSSLVPVKLPYHNFQERCCMYCIYVKKVPSCSI